MPDSFPKNVQSRAKYSPAKIETKIQQFLTRRTSEMEQAGCHARDVIIYFVEHGGFTSDNQYFLLIRQTHRPGPLSSTLQMASLAGTIKNNARFQRRILILDCCFAGAAAHYQNTHAGEVALRQTIEAFKEPGQGRGTPSRGTSLLCSSSRDMPSISLPGEPYTAFSGALLQVLNHGNSSLNEDTLSLRTVEDLVTNVLHEKYRDQVPLPEVHSPDQSEGDVANLPLFPNMAKRSPQNPDILGTQVAPSQPNRTSSGKSENLSGSMLDTPLPDSSVTAVLQKDDQLNPPAVRQSLVHSEQRNSQQRQESEDPCRQRSPFAFSWRQVLCLILLFLLVISITVNVRQWYLLSNAPVAPNLLVVKTLEDNVSDSLRQEIATAQRMRRAIITFDSSLQGKIKLTKDLEIHGDIHIEAEVSQQITLLLQYPSIRIHIPQGTTVSFVNIDFQGNIGTSNSNFIMNEGTLHIRKGHISYMQSRRGALYNLNGTLTLTQTEIDDNKSPGDGGGAIYNLNGTLILDESKIHDNHAKYTGGGIYSLNGKVFIQNQSQIEDNEVLPPTPGDSNLGGGGGMTISGGTISISNSNIENNTSRGNGGGILLIGASAQIYRSFIQYNQTYTNQAGGIAVESHSENNRSSSLVLADNTLVQYNSNSNSPNSTDFAVNIDGTIVGQDSVSQSITSEPLSESSRLPSDPTTFKEYFQGYLTLNDFQVYCQNQRQHFDKVSLSSDAQTITCTYTDDKSLLLSTQNDQVNRVCAMSYSPANANLTLARLFSYGDSTSWQCFQNVQRDTKNGDITNPVASPPLDQYCQTLQAKAVLLPPLTAYDWSCKQGTKDLTVNMDKACQTITHNSFAITKLEDYSKPDSWQCWVPISTNQTVTGTPPPTTSRTPMPTSA